MAWKSGKDKRWSYGKKAQAWKHVWAQEKKKRWI